jgi:glutaredoxin
LLLQILYIIYYCTEILGCNDEILPDHMTSVVHPNQVHSAIVNRSIPVWIIPDVVSSSPSEAVACSMPCTGWDTRRKELAKYKQQNNGSTNVPQQFPSNIPLGIWVKTQRQQYKLLQENENSHMTTERIESLNELDFEWVCVKNTFWEDRFQELTIYKQANGSTNVPQQFPSNKPLGQWVLNQRTQYKLLQEHKTSAMTTERIKSLNELDFEWVCVKNPFWKDRFQELTIYKQANGSTNVPQRCPSNKPLGQWVRRQRYQYKLLQEGKKSAMTTEHIKSLNELDFEWGHGKAKAAS